MSMAEHDPNGKPAHSPGAKMDAGKAPIIRGVLQYFPHALEHVANVSAKGAAKYAWRGWESVPNGFSRYSDALGRHLLAEATQGPYDSDTGELHAAQVAWNALARLELYLRSAQASNAEAVAVEHRGEDAAQLNPAIDMDVAALIPDHAPPEAYAGD